MVTEIMVDVLGVDDDPRRRDLEAAMRGSYVAP